MIEYTPPHYGQDDLMLLGKDSYAFIPPEYPGKWFDDDWCTVIAVDPGGTIGYCVMAVHPESLYKKDVSILDNIGFWTTGNISTKSAGGSGTRGRKFGPVDPGEAAGISGVIGLTRLWPRAFIVIEDFTIRKFDQSRDFVSPLRITGGFNLEFWRSNRKYYLQQPAFAKTTVTDARLRQWGFTGGKWKPTTHEKDATRHAVTFFRQLVGNNKEQLWCYNHLFGKGNLYEHSQAFE